MGYFVVPDIHGCNEPLQKALDRWNPLEEKLIQLGDMVDRGPNSLSVLLEMKKQKEAQNAIVLKGNHEQLFLDFLEKPTDSYFYLNGGGRATVNSFFDTDVTYRKTTEYIADYIKGEFQDVVQFIRDLPLYHEEGSWVFVHAGVNLRLEDWRKSEENDFTWIREDFHLCQNPHRQKFVFGHTPTRRLHDDEKDDLWLSACQTKFGLDGACVFGGQLNVLQINGENYQTFAVKA